MKSHTNDQRSNIVKTMTNLGRPLQDHPLLKTRKLPSRIHGWKQITLSMEHCTPQEVSSVAQ